MSDVNVQIISKAELERANLLLAGIPDGVNRAIKAAMPRAASHLRSHSSEAIQERYAISTAGIRSAENVKLNYQYSNGGVEARVRFSGNLIPLWRYDGSGPRAPSPQRKLVPVMIKGRWTLAHPGNAARGHQLKSTVPTTFDNGFTAKMKSGHIGIFERTGGMTADGSDAIHEIMGSSVAQMVGHEDVATSLTDSTAKKFEERFEHEITRLLNGWGG